MPHHTQSYSAIHHNKDAFLLKGASSMNIPISQRVTSVKLRSSIDSINRNINPHKSAGHGHSTKKVRESRTNQKLDMTLEDIMKGRIPRDKSDNDNSTRPVIKVTHMQTNKNID